MSLDSNGECTEKCGEGLNHGLLQCDDGNLQNGDGCSSICEVEDNYICSGIGKISNCSKVSATIDNVFVTDNNHILLYFNHG